MILVRTQMFMVELLRSLLWRSCWWNSWKHVRKRLILLFFFIIEQLSKICCFFRCCLRKPFFRTLNRINLAAFSCLKRLLHHSFLLRFFGHRLRRFLRKREILARIHSPRRRPALRLRQVKKLLFPRFPFIFLRRNVPRIWVDIWAKSQFFSRNRMVCSFSGFFDYFAILRIFLLKLRFFAYFRRIFTQNWRLPRKFRGFDRKGLLALMELWEFLWLRAFKRPAKITKRCEALIVLSSLTLATFHKSVKSCSSFGVILSIVTKFSLCMILM